MRRGRIEEKTRETRERRDATRACLMRTIRGSRAPRRSTFRSEQFALNAGYIQVATDCGHYIVA